MTTAARTRASTFAAPQKKRGAKERVRRGVQHGRAHGGKESLELGKAPLTTLLMHLSFWAIRAPLALLLFLYLFDQRHTHTQAKRHASKQMHCKGQSIHGAASSAWAKREFKYTYTCTCNMHIHIHLPLPLPLHSHLHLHHDQHQNQIPSTSNQSTTASHVIFSYVIYSYFIFFDFQGSDPGALSTR